MSLGRAFWAPAPGRAPFLRDARAFNAGLPRVAEDAFALGPALMARAYGERHTHPSLRRDEVLGDRRRAVTYAYAAGAFAGCADAIALPAGAVKTRLLTVNAADLPEQLQ